MKLCHTRLRRTTNFHRAEIEENPLIVDSVKNDTKVYMNNSSLLSRLQSYLQGVTNAKEHTEGITMPRHSLYSIQVTHNASPVTPINYWGTVLKESDDLVILGVTIDSKLTFEKHLCLVSRAASQRLGIFRKSWRVFHDGSLLERCFRGFVLLVVRYCSAVWCSAADTHLKLLDRAVSGARFLTVGVFECDISHRRSVAVLCILYKISCNPMHPLNDALPGPYVPVRVSRSALVAHRYTYAPPRCRTSQYRRTFVPLSVSLWNDVADPVFGGVGLAGFKSKANVFHWSKLLYPYYSFLLFFLFSSSCL